MAPSPYRTPAPRPPPTRKSEVRSAWMSVLIIGGSFAVLLPCSVYFAPLAAPALLIPALRAKALNPTSRLLNYLLWVGFCGWASFAVGEKLVPDVTVGPFLAFVGGLASLPVVFTHWSAFRALRAAR
jgi:hypothetical protein